MASPVLSIVAPAYNEERNIPAFLAAIIPVLEGIGETFEIIFVNDGSRDNTLGLLAAAASQDPRIKVIGLARNFGKDIALSAGLAHASGSAVIPIDCDLQHPPELIPAFVARWREGYDMVLGVRSKRDEEGYVRRTLSRTYYKVMRFMTSVEIPPNAGDFRLLDRKILDVINKMPERHRFMKGIFAWPGFKVASIEFQANVRANETRSTWSFFKLWRFALDGLFSFSTAPLKLWTYIGALSAGGAFLYLLITVIQKLFWGIAVPGYASLLIVVLFLGGLLLISNGIQGEYIARIFEEVKGRPLYVIGSTFGFDAATLAAGAPRAAVPVLVPGQPTAPHVAPPPPLNPNATQVGIATGPVSPPGYPPPVPVPASGPLAMSSGPHVAPNATPPPQPLPRTKSPTASPSISEPRAKTPSTPPASEPRPKTPSMSPPVNEPRAKTPSMSPPVNEPRAKTPSMSPVAGASHAAPNGPHATPQSGSHAAPPPPPPASDRSSARTSRPPSAQPVSAFGPTAPTPAVAPTAAVAATPSPAVTAPGIGAMPATAPGLGAAPAAPGEAEPTVPTAAPPPSETPRPKRELPKPTKGPTAPRS